MSEERTGPPRTSWREGVAGACAGALSRTLLAPVERVKLVQQLDHHLPRQSARQVAAQIYAQEGLYSFWRGNWPSCWRVAGQAAINFTGMSYYKQLAHEYIPTRPDQERLHNFLISLVSGGLAGFTGTTLLYPLEFVRTRLALDRGSSGGPLQQQQHRQFQGSLDVVGQIIKTDGIKGVYQGYGVAVTGGVLFRILLLGGYDATKNELLWYRGTTALGWWDRILLAQVVSATAGTICYPLDTIRRRMMMQAGRPQQGSTRLYRNGWDCFRTVVRTEGWKSLYRGLGANLVRSVSGALLLVGYDTIRGIL